MVVRFFVTEAQGWQDPVLEGSQAHGTWFPGGPHAHSGTPTYRPKTEREERRERETKYTCYLLHHQGFSEIGREQGRGGEFTGHRWPREGLVQRKKKNRQIQSRKHLPNVLSLTPSRLARTALGHYRRFPCRSPSFSFIPSMTGRANPEACPGSTAIPWDYPRGMSKSNSHISTRAVYVLHLFPCISP